jgi:hypothetical protein
MGWLTEELELDSREGQHTVSSTASRPALGFTQPPYPVGTGTRYPEVTRQGREADRSPPTNVKVKKSGATLPLPHTSFWGDSKLIN